MKKNIFLTVLMMALATGVAAQSETDPAAERAQVNIRYVSTDGKYENDGLTWASAKKNIQDAINDLVDHNLTGEVWVAKGKYTPTESTESSGGSTLYMAFKVPTGITVRGGFAGTEESKDDRQKTSFSQEINGQTVQQDWNYTNETILSGSLADTDAKFEWNTTKQYWETSFYGNCYHVVWFATEGFDPETGRANALNTSVRGEACVEGFTIKNGNARNFDLTGRFHNAYGGGAYMVWGSRLENCRVVNCEASRDGGGVYMDGGGVVKHCYIANNQALGVGVQNGYGGGICLDINGKPDRYGIYRSAVYGNVGRMGGGLAVKSENSLGVSGYETIPEYYRGFVSAVLVANNTATTEGGGVYSLGGGAFTNLTVVNNRCNGTGIISNDMQTGRAGGMYCRDRAVVFNSVFWGNDCEANDDIQFAATKSASGVENVDMQFCALEKSDYVDWSATTKLGVFTLSEYDNLTAAGANATDGAVYPNFIDPTANAGYDPAIEAGSGGTGSGDIQDICWIPGPNSGLANAGIVSLDLNPDLNLPFVSIPNDILDRPYNSRSTLGAYTRKFGNMKPAQAQLCNEDGTPNASAAAAWHFFVDPDAPTGVDHTDHGVSWNKPARFLGNVLHTIDSLRRVPVDGFDLGTQENPNRVFVHVKEGTVNTTNSYSSGRARNIPLRVPSNVTILGGYPEQLTGTELTKTDADDGTVYRRNPILYPTNVTGEIIPDLYEMNSVRLFTLNGVSDVVIDGLQIRYGNARSNYYNEDYYSYDGGGISMNKVTGVTVRNTLISGCTANQGAAVYVADGNSVLFENCIFHNNESKNLGANPDIDDDDVLGGVIHTDADSELQTKFLHCNIINNVGYAVSISGKAAQVWENSMAFANMKQENELCYISVDESKDKTKRDAFHALLAGPALLPEGTAESQLTLTNSLFDEHFTINGEKGNLSHVLNKKISDPDPVEGHTHITAFPRFVNGVVNVGVSLGGDITFYGRATSFEPHNDNPMVNAAQHTGDPATNAGAWGYDMSSVVPRTYGGLPDVGAIENHAATATEAGENAYVGGQQPYGEIIYVKENGSDSNSGFSWDAPLATVQAAIEKASKIALTNEGEELIVKSISIPANADLNTVQDLLDADWFQIHSKRKEQCWWNATEQSVSGLGVDEPNATIMTTTLFTLEDDDNTSDSYYYIKTFAGTYVSARNISYKNSPAMAVVESKSDATLFRIEVQNGGLTFSTSVNTNLYLYDFSNTNIGWYNIGSGSYWEAYTAAVETETKILGKKAQVWVAEGTYTKKSDDADHALFEKDVEGESVRHRVHNQKYSIMLREGVNVYGGFSRNGYPGFDDRNPQLYKTIVQPGDPVGSMTDEDKTEWANRGITGDYPLEYRANSTECGSFGRVVVQQEEFDAETVFDGFTITNGYLNTTSQVQIKGNLYTIMENSEYQVGVTGGAGVYLLRGGVIENCIIKGNMTYSNPENNDKDAATAENANKTFVGLVKGDDGGFHSVAAGVYNKGGVIKNSVISHNMILFELMRETTGYDGDNTRRNKAAWLYGAGLFQESGTVYNTIIHDNIQKITNFKSDGSHFDEKKAHDDPYSTNGKDNNEFWASSLTTGLGDKLSNHQAAAGAGVFLVAGDFYNNTVINNTYRLWPTYCKSATMIGIGGVYAFDNAKLYNCIITDNEPASLVAAGMAHPYTEDFVRENLTSGYNTYINFPIICFNTASGTTGYNLKDDALTVRYSAVNYEAAIEKWEDVQFPESIKNLCLTNDSRDMDNPDAYFFSADNSYGYAGNELEGNYTGSSYSYASGTNWYGRKGTTESSELYDPSTYKLTSTSPAMNYGTNYIPNVDLPSYDAEYTDRIKDCTVDMGAYEFNDAYAILPDLRYKDNTQVVDSAIYYVTPNGRGLASAGSPENAACADKLQKVLAAAGRYKYQNPDVKVVVKVAYGSEWHALGTSFKYYATTTTTTTNPDVRLWSIIVPRGVEVWGGYSDTYESEEKNGFYTKTTENNVEKYSDNRSITDNPTYFDSYYYSDEVESGIYTYHVVTFTDYVYDGEGNPYLNTPEDIANLLAGENSVSGTARVVGTNFLTMSGVVEGQTYGGVDDRAVIDGIHITGGRADVKAVGSGSQNVNINRYGGAAIVTDYAHVRNCIVRENQGVYGGALALTHGALVTGCLIEENTAEYGGAIYVFPDGTVLPDGTVDTKNPDYDENLTTNATRYDLNMPHVLSSTIVNNKATVQGGGVWFTDNVRFNSVAIWQNICKDMANVAGTYYGHRPDGQTYTTTEYYPFNYSAVQDIEASGLNNVKVKDLNRYGMRFYSQRYVDDPGQNRSNLLAVVDDQTGSESFERMNDFGNYSPSDYSLLVRGGMPLSEYNRIAGEGNISLVDFMGVSRSVSKDDNRAFIEIGALASDKEFEDKGLMLRLYVASPEDIDDEAALAMAMAELNNADQGGNVTDATVQRYNSYYSQEGSSFAYPFQDLQDALDYIYRMRGFTDGVKAPTTADVKYYANNMSFEIFLASGTFRPSVDLTGMNNDAVGNTFLIPEGVSLIGGHSPNVVCDYKGKDPRTDESTSEEVRNGKHFFGAHSEPAYAAYNDGGVGESRYDMNYYYVDSNKDSIYITDADGKKQQYRSHTITYDGKTYTIHHVYKDVANATRQTEDINANSVVEPWELAEQTVLSGKVEGVENNGVNHVITIIADERFCGALPTVQGEPEEMFPHPKRDSDVGYQPHEHGQIIALDGLTITGGYAYGYKEGTMDNHHKMKYNNGGAILVDGNRYQNSYNYPDNYVGSNGEQEGEIRNTYTYQHGSKMATVGFREIPLMINRCKFEDNVAGFGGAISTNTTLDVINSTFEHNRALAGHDKVDYVPKDKTETVYLDVDYPGAGGAIYATYQVTGINTMFANNEAVDPDYEGLGYYTILSDLIWAADNDEQVTERPMIAGSGGAVTMSRKGHFHFLNCNFVNNAANAYPAIFTVNPNYQYQLEKQNDAGYVSTKDYNQALNCVFWGNDITDHVKGVTELGGETKDESGNPIKYTTPEDRERYLWGINKVVNYGPADRWDPNYDNEGSDEMGDVKSYTIGVDKVYHAWTQQQLDKENTEINWRDADGTVIAQPGYTEQIWFSAYEDGKGKTPRNPRDLRRMTFTPRVHVKKQICDWLVKKFDEISVTSEEIWEADGDSATSAIYQNCNIMLASENSVSDGPNFVNPSTKAGYDGYMESADWSPARINNLTDAGWGRIEQTIDPVSKEASFVKYGETNPEGDEYTVPSEPEDRSQYSSESDGVDDDGNRDETKATYVIEGAYSAIRYMRGNEKFQKTMPIGTQEYMHSSFYGNSSDVSDRVSFYRISYDPNPTQNQTFIDMGVYEYYHAQLNPEYISGDEVDILWVSAVEKDNQIADGNSWETPTSDLQRAIETLLSSRNGRRKEIRLLDGTFVPIYTIKDNLGFYIDTEYQNDKVTVNNGEYGKGVMSLTIKGGYSSELENTRDVDEYPAVIRQQRRTDGNSDNHRWDHLFYIKDPTQRYAVQGGTYDEANGFGHRNGDGQISINTIPIEFDGVTLINDQAAPGTVGSVIHYAGLQEMLTNAGSSYDKTRDIEPTSVNVTVKHSETVDADGTTTTDRRWTELNNPAKIILSKTKIYGSGRQDVAETGLSLPEGTEPAATTVGDLASAVYLGDAQGGHAILYNNVMHSNTVNPLVSGAKTLTVNNTFALNDGQVYLAGKGSTIHNSVLWRNNPAADEGKYGAQFYLAGYGMSNAPTDQSTITGHTAATAQYLSRNAYTFTVGEDGKHWATTSDDYSATGQVSTFNYNVALDNSNTNFTLGPNFTNPEDADLAKRDFTLMPSVRLLNQGQDSYYEPLAVSEDAQTGDLYDLAYEPTWDEDAATNPRFRGTIDLGAYEYQKLMRRVLYVNPNTISRDDRAGDNWENPIGIGGLQDAIDLAALYHYSNPEEQAFVFVRGTTLADKNESDWVHTDETVMLRNGVTILGGINPSYNVSCTPVEANETTTPEVYTYTDSEIEKYLGQLDEINEGYIGPNTHRTAIKGIVTDASGQFSADGDAPTDKTFRIESKITGFHVTPLVQNGKALKVSTPIIDVNPTSAGTDGTVPNVVLDRIVVYDNIAEDGATGPMARMSNSLIYGAIFRDNTPPAGEAVLQLNDNAYAVNVSVQGATESKVTTTTTEGETTTTTTDYVRKYNGHGMQGVDYEKTTRIFNSLVNYGKEDPQYTLSSDLAGATGTAADTLVTAQTKYTFSGHNYRRKDRNMYFQLSEGSKHINEIKVTKGAGHTAAMSAIPTNLLTFINYQTDRDVLGNPRLLTLKDGVETDLLDRGAFETWKVERDTWTHEHNHATGGTDAEGAAHDHFSPHTGSVVYVAEGKKLVCGTDFHPGFLLLKDGASLYGNGHNVWLSFVAVEREIEPNGSVVSMPFPMNYDKGQTFSDGIGRSYYENYNEIDGTTTLTHEMGGILHIDYDEGTKVYDYDPLQRSNPTYSFSPTSGAWVELATQRNVTTKAANEGVLVVPDPAVVEQLYGKQAPYLENTTTGEKPRLIYSFTSMGATWDDNVYVETADEKFKSVTLTQNDDRESTDGGADFTSKEDMGWNLIGLPYLVSDYKTHENGYAQKELGTVDKGGTYTNNVYNMDIPHELWLYYDGKTNDAGEFIAPDNSKAEGDGGFYKVDSWSASNADWHLSTEQDTEGNYKVTPRIWWGEGIFTQTASVAGDELLKFYRPVAPEEPTTPSVTPDNPDTPSEARTRGNKRYYVLESEMEEEEETVVPVRIMVDGHDVTITGLEGDERISIFDASGRIRLSDRAGGSEFSTTIPEDGIYIIRVDNLRQKVLVK